MTRPDRIEPFDDDARIDERIAGLLRATPEPTLTPNLAARAIRLAAREPASQVSHRWASRRWVTVLNVVAAIAVAAVVLVSVWDLSSLGDSIGSSESDATSTSTASSTTSISQWSSFTTDELLIGGALLVAAAAAQIVLRGPVRLPRLPAIQTA